MANFRFLNRRNEIGFPRVNRGAGAAGAAPLPPNEAERLDALRRYDILDTPPEPAFERITCLAARLLQAPFALVSLVDEERQWFKSCHGMSTTETEREVSFCAHAILKDQVMVVPDATRDPRFAQNPVVVGRPHIRFYAGAPLRTPGGLNMGTLCVLDTAPRAGLKPAERETLSDLAAVVVDAMELRIAAGRIQAENTRRREAEEAVREAHENLLEAWGDVERERERYKELFTFAPDGYLVTDPEGTIREANEATARMLNVLPESLSGKPFVHFVVEPEHHNFRTLLRRLQSVDRVHDWEVRLKPRGAPPFVAAVTGGAVRGTGGESLTLRWMVRDITERKQAEEERYRLLSEGRADQPIILLDAAGAPVGWSAPAERLWMGRAEPDEGSTAPRLFPEEGPEKKRLERSLMVASSEGRFDEEGWRLRRDGTRFWAHEVILPLRDGQGRLKSFVCFARDLTAGRRTDSA